MNIFLLAMILVFSTGGSVSARIIEVPFQQPTIQDGIDSASPGDTVLVFPGTYRGDGNRDLDFKGKNIVVMSEGGADSTVIDCEGSTSEFHRGFNFHTWEEGGSVLHGFTVRNGFHHDGGGIYCEHSSPRIVNCVIENNFAFGYDYGQGGGIRLINSSAHITDCRITGNVAVHDGGGINGSWFSGKILRCTFSFNHATGYKISQGGGLFLGYSSPEISSCIIESNSASHHGGGICFSSYSNAVLNNCIVRDNQVGSSGCGAGLSFWNNSEPVLFNCIVSGNTTPYKGGGVSCSGCEPALVNCTISGNHAQLFGSGIFVDSYAEISVLNSILWDDADDEIYLWVSSSKAVVTYSDVAGGWEGTGNRDEDPRFFTGEFHGFDLLLLPDSPCIDSGDPEISDRIYDRNPFWPEWFPDDRRSDMGAYGGENNWRWLTRR